MERHRERANPHPAVLLALDGSILFTPLGTFEWIFRHALAEVVDLSAVLHSEARSRFPHAVMLLDGVTCAGHLLFAVLATALATLFPHVALFAAVSSLTAFLHFEFADHVISFSLVRPKKMALTMFSRQGRN